VDLIDRLAEDPAHAGLFFDVDGVLAPIVARPQDARVPDETGTELHRLNERYALVACISGRAGDEARRIVGVPELVYVGNHGLELDGVKLKPAQVSWANEDQLRFALREGRKRQIRRMCEQVGLVVTGLKRVRTGGVPLGKLPVGQWRYLRRDEKF
jgi:trehalose-phosphatase